MYLSISNKALHHYRIQSLPIIMYFLYFIQNKILTYFQSVHMDYSRDKRLKNKKQKKNHQRLLKSRNIYFFIYIYLYNILAITSSNVICTGLQTEERTQSNATLLV